MGNTSNKDQWAVRERLVFIERLAWWRGVVNRGDVRDVFGISAAQASSDLQAYQEMNPLALVYNVRKKRYEAQPAMECVMHTPSMGEAVRLFLGEKTPGLPVWGAVKDHARVDVFQPLARKADAGVERRIFLALDQKRRVRIRYWSVNSGKMTEREIAPHALGHDGYRWHVRAWCFTRELYRDFNLSRMETAEWLGEEFTPIPRDEEWETIETVKLRANPALSPERRKAMELDYGMTQGVLEVQVRKAMRSYFLAHCRIPVTDGQGEPLPAHLALEEQN